MTAGNPRRMTTHADGKPVAVVGAGCAGATAAWHLARAGVPTWLFDLQKAPGERAACGGMMLHSLRHRMRMPDELVDGEVDRVWVIRGRERRRLDFRTPVFVNFDRCRFDAHLVGLAEDAGCVRHAGARVREWDPERSTLTWTTGGQSHEAAFSTVVFADGPRSVARAHGLGLTDETPMGSAFYREIETDEDRVNETDFYLDLPADDPGYIWVFPKRGFTQVGVGRLNNVTQRPLRDVVDDFIEKDPRYRGRRVLVNRGGGIPVGLAQRVSRPGGLVIGDAAGLVNPITGGGLLYAIASAEMAALAVVRGLERGDRAAEVASRIYARRLKGSIHWWWLKSLAVPFNHFCRRLRQGRNPNFLGLFMLYARVLPRLTPAARTITDRMPATSEAGA
jgi:geranylgeranyl reductase family protein